MLQSTKDEAEWLDPDSKKLNTTGLDQLKQIRNAMKNLAKLRANLEDMEKGRKSTSPKGDKPPPPPAAGAKRKMQAEPPPAPKKRKQGRPKPTTYPPIVDPEDDMDASKPIAERLRNSPKLSPAKLPPSRLGKGKEKSKGHGEKPTAARSLHKEPADNQTSGSSDQGKDR